MFRVEPIIMVMYSNYYCTICFLLCGTKCYAKGQPQSKWKFGKVISSEGTCIYKIKFDGGKGWRRHIYQ